MTLKLEWLKCKGDIWCSFQNLTIDHAFFDGFIGVYIIWQEKDVIKIGGGNFRNCIIEDRNNENITFNYPSAKVTYAQVDSANISGVIRFLEDNLAVQIQSQKFDENTQSIEVNFPWW
ncbi:MAG: hypothetical protein ACJASQ_001248 [Crocinitomicaceae bacterium]|jgi:hypothetical protein